MASVVNSSMETIKETQFAQNEQGSYPTYLRVVIPHTLLLLSVDLSNEMEISMKKEIASPIFDSSTRIKSHPSDQCFFVSFP